MFWLGIQRGWALWRRLDAIHLALWRCSRHTDMIGAECERLKIPEHEMRKVIAILSLGRKGVDGAHSSGREEDRISPESRRDPLANAVKELVLELIKLPIVHEDPFLARENVAYAAYAAAAGDLTIIPHLIAVIEEAYGRKLEAIQQDAEMPADGQWTDMNTTLDEQRLKNAAATAELALLTLEAPDWKSVHDLLLETQSNPQLAQQIRSVTADVIFRQDRGKYLSPSHKDALLTILRRRLGDVTAELADQSGLSRDAVDRVLDALPRYSMVSFSALREEWRLPSRSDLAWGLLIRLSLRKLEIYHERSGFGKFEGSEAERFEDGESAGSTFRMPILEGSNALPDAEVWNDIRWLLTSDYARMDPELALRVTAERCKGRAVFSWRSCLDLANERVHPYRYLADEISPDEFEVNFESRQQANGSFSIPFTVMQQSLPVRFHRFFKTADLKSQVRILWHLIRFAGEFRTSSLVISVEELMSQVSLREEKLWARIQNPSEVPLQSQSV